MEIWRATCLVPGPNSRSPLNLVFARAGVDAVMVPMKVAGHVRRLQGGTVGPRQEQGPL